MTPRADTETGNTMTPILVRDWELSRGVPQLTDCERFLAARLLVRLHGQPLGWLHLDAPGASIPAPQLQRALGVQLGAALQRAALQVQLGASATSAHDSPGITVVVCTRNRTASLSRCLDSLLAVEYPAFEILVVDNAPSSDDTASLIASLRQSNARATALLRYTREPSPGLDWARNRGMREAQYDIVAYTDDDVFVDAHWLDALADAFATADVMLVTGLVVPAELETDAQVVFEDWYGGMGKGLHPRHVRPEWSDVHERLGAHHLGVGANLALRRPWLVALGGFDTALDVGTPSHGGGDLDIMHRSLAAGAVARYAPTAIVRHYHRRQMHDLRRQLRDNGRAFGVYLLSRWSRHETPRIPVLRYATGTWLAWMLGRIPRRFRRRERMPLSLQAEEWIGAIQSPWVWYATYASDRRLRAAKASQGGTGADMARELAPGDPGSA